MALGALEAWRSSRPKDLPIIVGFDATDEARRFVKRGLAATIAQDPAQMGREAARALPELWTRKDNPPLFVDKAIPVQTVTQ
jgi:ABC-type sugar transport system substrate-binding protein